MDVSNSGIAREATWPCVSERGAAGVIVLLLLVLVFLAGTVYFALQAKRNADDLSKAQETIVSLEKKGGTEAGSPVREPAVSIPKAPDVKELEHVRRVEAAEEEVVQLRRRVQELEDLGGQLGEKEASAKSQIEALEGRLQSSHDQVADLSQQLREARSDVTDAAKELEARTEAISKAQAAHKKSEVRREQLLSQVKAITTKSTEIITSLTRSNEELEARITDLAGQLKRYPDEPLGDEAANAEYQVLLGKLEETSDRGERVLLAFKAKQQLAGSARERSADSLWRKEDQLHQREIEAAGSQAYRAVSSKVRSQPDAHEENVRILQEALQKARGSRREASIRELLEREQQRLEESRPAVEEPAEPEGAAGEAPATEETPAAEEAAEVPEEALRQ